MVDLWRDFGVRETGTGQQVAQLHERYMMMMMINAVKMEDIKIINAQQSKATRAYKNTNQKLLKTKAAPWFKKKKKVSIRPSEFKIR